MNTFLLFISLISTAVSHPFSQEEYSLRTAITVSEKGLVPLVVLEIPIPIALREIGATTDDPREVKKRKINKYNQAQWSTLSDNLIFTVDGKVAQGQWMAIDHPANGKASEGFFIYMVSFNFQEQPALQSGSQILIDNQAYPQSKIVFSGSVTAKEPWRIASSTTADILGENEQAELSDPKRWSTDSALRSISVTIERD